MSAYESLPRALPESQGVSTHALLSFFDGIEREIKDLHGFMLLRHGSVVAEAWWKPYGPELHHMLFSLSKSFTSTAVGFAVSEGLLTVDDPVLSFFPDDAPRGASDNLTAMRIRHLLSMSTGHDKDTMEAVLKNGGRKAERKFLSLPVENAPGTHFVYNTGATYMLAAIVQKLTGQTLTEYLTPRLFQPLGIQGARWERSLTGVDFGGFGLNLRTEDIARFGQLYLDKGLWKGRRVLSEAWIREATARQISNGDAPDSDWTQGYGYQFWRCRPAGSYRGDGAFGQYCIVMPEQDSVIAITSGLGDMQIVLNRIWEKLLPGMREAPLPASPDADALARTLAGLHYDPPQGPTASSLAPAVSGVEYTLEKNLLGWGSIRFDFAPDSCIVHAKIGRRRAALTIGYAEWRDGGVPLPSEPMRLLEESPVVASGVWSAPDTFVVTMRQVLTPFVHTLSFRFDGNRIIFDREINVSFDQTKAPTVIGQRTERQ